MLPDTKQITQQNRTTQTTMTTTITKGIVGGVFTEPFLMPMSRKIFGPSYLEKAVKEWGDKTVDLTYEIKQDCVDIVKATTRDVVATIDSKTGILTERAIAGSETAIQELRSVLSSIEREVMYYMKLFEIIIVGGCGLVASRFAPNENMRYLMFHVATIAVALIVAAVVLHRWWPRNSSTQRHQPPTSIPLYCSTKPLPTSGLPQSKSPDDYRVLNFVTLPDDSLRLDLFTAPWSLIEALAKVLSDPQANYYQACSRVTSLFGDTGVGKSLFIGKAMGPDEVRPASRDPQGDNTGIGKSLGVCVYPTRLGGSGEVTLMMDPEGSGGIGVPEDGRTPTARPTSLSGALCQLANMLPGGNGFSEDETVKRLEALKYDMPKLLYLMSDLLVFVGQDMSHNHSYQEQAAFLRGIGSGDRFAKPALMLIRNKAPYDEYMQNKAPRSIASTTKQYMQDHMTDDDLQFYSSIHFVLLPNLYDARFSENILFDRRIQEIRDLMKSVLAQQQTQRAQQGTLFDFDVWCRIMKSAVSCYQNPKERSVRRILNKIQLEGMSDREQVLMSFMDRATLQDVPSNDHAYNVSFYNTGVESGLAATLSSVMTCLHRIRGVHNPIETATDLALENCLIAAERVKGNAPCVHQYNGARYKQNNESIVCTRIKRDHGDSHHSTRLVFGSRPDEGFWAQIEHGINYVVSKHIVAVGGREACWNNGGDTPKSDTSYKASRYLIALGTKEAMRGHVSGLVSQILAMGVVDGVAVEAGDDLVRARGIALMAKALKFRNMAADRFRVFDYCLGCGVKLNRDDRSNGGVKTFKGCHTHSVCVDCYACVTKHPWFAMNGTVYRLREYQCPFH